MKPFRYLAAVALVAAAQVSAAPAPAGVSNWAVNKATSQIGFRSSVGGQAFTGSFRRWDARIAFDPKALDKSSVVAVVETGSAVSGDATRDEQMPTDDWFGVAKFPRATFVAKRFQSLGGNRYRADGTLTIRNVTRPAALPFQLVIAGDRAKMVGQLSVDRSAYGVGKGQFASADTIPFAVAVTIRIDATRQR
jgi:polyisoprenoid-binding protein YceI